MSSTLLLAILSFFTLVKALHGATPAFPSATCRDTCGSIPVKYPFGTGFGCGHPNFTRYVKCESGTLQLTTGSGTYTISSIDYTSTTLIVTDLLMSTCNSMQNSGSFGLDSEAPFEVTPENTFVLLGCSKTSPVYDTRQELCDTGASNVCRGVYSCKGVTGIGLVPNAPISTCCVYDPPVGSGSGYIVDLPKLQCSSYTCVYGYGEDEGDPAKWQYGISLHYNGSYHTDACKECETSAGVCGFNGSDESLFLCACPNGVNTTVNCYGQGYAWSRSWRLAMDKRISILGILLLSVWLFG